jgi:UDP-N-acetylmuramoyl-tripeptide--D-alanyl-D-alanine ligase
MISMSVAEIASVVSGSVEGGLRPDLLITQYPVIDSRAASVETFFVAYRGENVDGHSFALSAVQAGSPFALVSTPVAAPSIRVSDVTAALATLAHHVRTRLTDMQVIGVTGSQGKTTTKDLLAHILITAGETVAPEGSLNNEIGVPLTLLRATPSTKFCIVEMGARHKGDISHLVKIAEPNIGAVLVVGSAHLGEFGSRAEIAEAKSEMVSDLASGATAVLGNFDEFTPQMKSPSGVARISFGESTNCDVRATDIEFREGRAHFDLVTPDGRESIGLQLLGMHQIANALAAAAIATALHIPIESIAAALSTAEATSKFRMELHEAGDIALIDDSYNANPESMAAALRTLVLIAQERGGVAWAVLGRMHELGDSQAEQHQEIGQLAANLGVDHLVAVGCDEYLTAVRGLSEMVVHSCANFDEALTLSAHMVAGDVVLVKASRAEHLDLLAAKMIESFSVQNSAVQNSTVQESE